METLKDLLDSSFSSRAGHPAVRSVTRTDAGDAYAPITYAELRGLRDSLAAGFAALGLRKGQRVGILTDGGFEPLLVFLAADALGLVSVPLCHKSSTEVLVHNISRSDMDLLLVDDRGLEPYGRVGPALTRPPRLLLSPGTEGDGIPWEEVQSEDDPPEVEVSADDESKILFTSGSSGLPKGVVQTHGNIVANVRSVWDLVSEKEVCRFFKSAPDYHSMGVLNIYYPLAKGWVLDLARSPDRVLSDIRISEPEGFLTVPLVLDKVYGNVRKEIDAGGLKGRLVDLAVRSRDSVTRGTAGFGARLVDRTLGGKVVAKIKQQLSSRVGAELEILVVGSAKADPDALDFFHYVLGINSYEGYGVTECAPLISTNHLRGRRVGTVGRPLFEVKLVSEEGAELARAEPAEDSFRTTDPAAVGELWVSGANVMRGYLDEPEQTSRVLVEDEEVPGKLWYRTGDLFSMDEDGFLTFRGRVGRQFKIANGEFVNPELLERIYSRAALVEHVLVTGQQAWSHPVIVVTVDVEEAGRQTDLPGLPSDEDQLRAFEPLHERIRQQLLAEADAAGLTGHERPVRLLVLPEALSEDAGTLTRGLRKIVPKSITERFAETIEAAAG